MVARRKAGGLPAVCGLVDAGRYFPCHRNVGAVLTTWIGPVAPLARAFALFLTALAGNRRWPVSTRSAQAGDRNHSGSAADSSVIGESRSQPGSSPTVCTSPSMRTRSKRPAIVARAAVYVVTTYRKEITSLITDTVAGWDAEHTTKKIEANIGRDLQFIRINGTVVGSLAGLLIYVVSRALGG